MYPDWNELQQQMAECYGWNFYVMFDSNHVPPAPDWTLTVAEDKLTEDDLQEWLNVQNPSIPEKSDSIK
jgi:hypothetical protein